MENVQKTHGQTGGDGKTLLAYSMFLVFCMYMITH